ncbi:MAG: hypothetical protein Q9183_004082 [Haloplaca sp. 2 TL-2023]
MQPWILLVATPLMVTALKQVDAETMYNAFNKVFLTISGDDIFYKTAINNGDPTETWAGSLNIIGTQDAYERTGDSEKKALVEDLLTTWLKDTPPPWDWDGWNDDIGWFSLALVRGYQMTGNQEFLEQAKYGFNYAFGRGWDTEFNGGGIWEENPEYTARYDPPKEPTKEALANDSLGKVACLIYQSTHEDEYLERAKQIYAWVRDKIYDVETGQVHTGIDKQEKVNTATAAYNQGTFIDYANLLYEITLDDQYFQDAKRTLDFARSEVTVNGVFSNDASYLNTWADEVARGAGHLVRDSGLWSTYYSWMKQNADAILQNQRPDVGLTWNAWAKPTPDDVDLTSNNVVSAMAWLQFTPAVQPNEIGGIHVIANQQTGMAIDSAGTFGNGKPVVQWGSNMDSLNQRWLLTQNSDTSWNIVSLSTWQSLDCPGGNGANDVEMVQWFHSRENNQRWWIDRQDDGTYKIWNKASEKALDGASKTDNGAALIQHGWNGGPQQRWILQ